MLDYLSSQLEEIFSDTTICYINEFLNLLPSKLCEFDTFGRKKIPTLTTFYILMSTITDQYPLTTHGKFQTLEMHKTSSQMTKLAADLNSVLQTTLKTL